MVILSIPSNDMARYNCGWGKGELGSAQQPSKRIFAVEIKASAPSRGKGSDEICCWSRERAAE